MGKSNIILLLSSLLIACFLLPSSNSYSYSYSKPKVTNLHFYLHDQFNTSQPIKYGDVFAFQEPFTVGPEQNSTFLGYSQGTIGFANNQGTLFDLHMSLSLVFHSGEYKGSTIVAVGQNNLTQATRQFVIVGGTGAFKLAWGSITARTFSEDPPIFIYDLEINQDTDGENMSERLNRLESLLKQQFPSIQIPTTDDESSLNEEL